MWDYLDGLIVLLFEVSEWRRLFVGVCKGGGGVCSFVVACGESNVVLCLW